MIRPGSAIKRKQKPLPQQVAKQQVSSSHPSRFPQNELKVPEATTFMKKRDWIAALTIFEWEKKYRHRQDLKTYLGIAYCAFHNGDYK